MFGLLARNQYCSMFLSIKVRKVHFIQFNFINMFPLIYSMLPYVFIFIVSQADGANRIALSYMLGPKWVIVIICRVTG